MRVIECHRTNGMITSVYVTLIVHAKRLMVMGSV